MKITKIRMLGCLLLDLIFVCRCQWIFAVRDGEEWCFLENKSASWNIASCAESLAFLMNRGESVGGNERSIAQAKFPQCHPKFFDRSRCCRYCGHSNDFEGWYVM